MKNRNILCLFLVLLAPAMASPANDPGDDHILVPQNGYTSSQPKMAIIRISADSFSILDSMDRLVLKGRLSERKYWSFSDEWVQWADLSELKTPGKYRIVIPEKDISRTFKIVPDPLSAIARAAVKALYYNRCSYAITPEYGGKWSRAAGHPDTMVYIHPSAASPNRPTGSVISAPGGWYDAGDFNKYIVNSGITTFTLLAAYEFFPAYWKTMDLHIPESDNHIPDILDEALYNLRWMMKMQDVDGGVYHKLTTRNFAPFVMPAEAHEPRFVVMKSTAASLDYAATMSHAARLFKGFAGELPGFADSCATAAEKAWNWCQKNPAVYYRQPTDITTGEYGDHDLCDEWFWAATELNALSGQPYPDSSLTRLTFVTPAWNRVATLGLITSLENKTLSNDIRQKCLEILYQYVSHLADISEKSGYPVSLDYFAWGSNSDVANQGMLKMIVYTYTQDKRLVNSALGDMNYITGMNPTGYCYITGFGERAPIHIHHRASASDEIPEPVPGFLVGGPNTAVFSDCPDAQRSKLPALSYLDAQCSYSTNEVAINWNTPLAFLAGALASLTR